jgi:hypothetical protein
MDFIKILKGMACGIIYVSSFFWTSAFTFLCIDASIAIVLLSAILTNAAVGLLMASNSHRNALYKWLISLPAGIITLLAYRETNFIYYWLNKAIPGYGDLSAGGGFALLLYIVFYIMSFSIAVIISFCITSQNIKKMPKVKL